MDVEGHEHSIIFWTSLIRKEPTEFTYADFTDYFIHPLINLLQNSVPPRLSDEIKKVLQLSE